MLRQEGDVLGKWKCFLLMSRERGLLKLAALCRGELQPQFTRGRARVALEKSDSGIPNSWRRRKMQLLLECRNNCVEHYRTSHWSAVL